VAKPVSYPKRNPVKVPNGDGKKETAIAKKKETHGTSQGKQGEKAEIVPIGVVREA